jgi:hypothetical protein
MPFFRFRPEHDTRVDDLTDPIEWEDNALSNAIAASSFYLLPKACQTPDHWTSRLANYFWTSCPCCAIYRGMVLGFFFATLLLTILSVSILLAAS